jgi:hypothetical protein
MGEIDGAFRSWGLARGGTGAISNAIAAAAREAGVEIRTEAPIAKILVREGRTRGVVLANGDEIEADFVSSSVDPRITFMRMLGEEHLPPEFVEGVSRYKFRGSSGKVNMALDGLPNFTCLPRRRPSSARRDLDFSRHRLHGTRLRRREVRAVLAKAVHRHRHPVADRIRPSRRRAST